MNSKKNTEADILKAAKKIFIQHGYAGARMQAIADEAKINKAMLHYYYRSKEALFGRIMDGAVDLMSQQFRKALSGTAPVMDKLKALISSYTDTINQNPYIPIFILNEIARNPINFQSKMQRKLEEENVLQNFMLQIMEEQEKEILRPLPIPQFMLTVMSLIVFPHIAKPVFVRVFGISDAGYAGMMEDRKELIYEMMQKTMTL